MWKQRAVTLCGCLAMLPLIVACSGPGGPPQAYAPQPFAPAQGYAPTEPYAAAPEPYATAPAAYAPVAATRIYAAAPGAPAAILLMLPGPGDMIAADPGLWTAQGFDVVTPTAAEMGRIVADQQMAMARLVAEAQALDNAPIWLMGPNSAIEAAMSSLPAGAGPVQGVVVTSSSNGTHTCSERMIYSYSGTGTPKVSVSKSGNACPPGSPFGGEINAVPAPQSPGIQPHAPSFQPLGPRVIEASAVGSSGSPAARRAAVQQIADLIKSPPG